MLFVNFFYKWLCMWIHIKIYEYYLFWVMRLLFVVNKCVLLTANFVVFYFVEMSYFVTFFLMKKGANNPILVLTELKFVFTTHNETRHILHRLKMTKFAQFSLQRFIQAKCMFQGQLILSYQTTNYITAVSEVLIRIIVGEFCSNLINFRPRGHKT